MTVTTEYIPRQLVQIYVA